VPRLLAADAIGYSFILFNFFSFFQEPKLEALADASPGWWPLRVYFSNRAIPFSSNSGSPNSQRATSCPPGRPQESRLEPLGKPLGWIKLALPFDGELSALPLLWRCHLSHRGEGAWCVDERTLAVYATECGMI
jgi:hypothetical protein